MKKLDERTQVRDLGTYWLRVEFLDGRGYLQKWETGRRYTKGTESLKPLDATVIEPIWGSEDDLFQTMIHSYMDGNYSCDCNKALFLARAYQQNGTLNIPCGATMELKRLTSIRPDGSEHELLNENQIRDY